jgi:hypothetical protein
MHMNRVGTELASLQVSLCRVAGRYDNPIPTRFLAPTDCSKNLGLHRLKESILESIPRLIEQLQIRALFWIYDSRTKQSK